jgi:hypothetical protein
MPRNVRFVPISDILRRAGAAATASVVRFTARGTHRGWSHRVLGCPHCFSPTYRFNMLPTALWLDYDNSLGVRAP